MPYILHTLYDDHGVLDDSKVCIQKIDVLFYNEEEARLVQDLCSFLEEEIDNDINVDMGYIDTEYMSHPLWPQIVAKAAETYELMKDNNEKYNFIECYNMFVDCHQKYKDWQEKFELERPQDI